MNKQHLIASSPTEEGIIGTINTFYYSDGNTLRAATNNVWEIVGKSGKIKEGVRVVYRKGRYRFEMTK